MVSFKYSVPRCGGFFVMPPGFVSRHTFLAKFLHVKMIAVNAIHSLNEEWMAKGDLLVAQTVIHNERRNIGLAREHFENGDYLCFEDNQRRGGLI